MFQTTRTLPSRRLPHGSLAHNCVYRRRWPLLPTLITRAIEVSELWQRACLPAYRAVCKRLISEQTDAIISNRPLALFTPQQTKTESNK